MSLKYRKSENRKFKIKALLLTAVFIFVICLTGCKDADAPDPYALRDEGVELYKEGSYKEAITRFNESLKASEGTVSDLQYDILKYRAECELRLEKYTAARTDYEKLAELDKDEEALSEYNAILSELDGLEAVAEAEKLVDDSDYSDAYDLYSEYAALDGTLTGKSAWFNKAICAEYLKNYEEASELLSQYLSKYPDDQEAQKEREFCRSRAEADNE